MKVLKRKRRHIANQRNVNYYTMANKIDVKELLEAGVHFGHMTRKWDPNMAPYIYM